MISRTVKILSAAAIAATFIGTVAVSGAVRTRMDAAGVQHAEESAKSSAASTVTQRPLYGHIACGMLSYLDCETLEMTLPM
jgi:hypothetical protein